MAGVQFLTGAQVFSSPKHSDGRYATWGKGGAVSERKAAGCTKLTSRIYLAPKLRKSGGTSPHPYKPLWPMFNQADGNVGSFKEKKLIVRCYHFALKPLGIIAEVDLATSRLVDVCRCPK